MEKDFNQTYEESIMDTFYVPNPTFYRTDTVCKFNGSVDCEKKDKCRKCGWNPYNIALHNSRVDIAMRRREVWLRGAW